MSQKKEHSIVRKKSAAPALQFHISGQSVVRIDGKDYYLGSHNSHESLARYAAIISTYQANGLTLPTGFDLRALDPQVAAILGRAAPQQVTNEPIRVNMSRHSIASI